MLMFQIHLYRFSITNNQNYDNTINLNNPSNTRMPHQTSNHEYYNFSNGYGSGYETGIDLPDRYSTNDLVRRRTVHADSNRYYCDNTSSINTDRYSCSYPNANGRANIDPSKRKSYPKPFRMSSSAGALLGHLSNGKQLSPSTENSRKPIHNFGKGQYYTRGIPGCRSDPTMNNNNNNPHVAEKRNKAHKLVVC